jgi:hypothetical protein
MIKSFKIFEKLKDVPEIGDYAIMQILTGDFKLDNFVNNTIGQISDVQLSEPDPSMSVNLYNEIQRIGVIYNNVPVKIRWWFSKMSHNKYKRLYTPNNLVEFAKTKEELELKLNANKYNL